MLARWVGFHVDRVGDQLRLVADGIAPPTFFLARKLYELCLKEYHYGLPQEFRPREANSPILPFPDDFERTFA